MNKSLARLLMGMVLLVGLCLGYSLWHFSQKPSLEECIKRLNSDDFHAMRRAQFDICAYGQSAIPRLRQSALASGGSFEAQICSCLIGDIDPKAYGTVLVDAAQLGKINVALHYPNPEAMQSLRAQERKDLISRIDKFHIGTSDDLNQLEHFITQPQDWMATKPN